jgi:drug/metabolite transporter (DMT)-like permease
MRFAPILMALTSAMLFGAAPPASKMLLADLPPFQLAGLLYLGAALAVAPVALSQGGSTLPLKSDRANKLRLGGAILFGGLLGPVALLFAISIADAISVSLWLNMELVVTAVLGVLVFKDHLSWRGWVGVMIAFAASILLTGGSAGSGLTAGVLVLGACICWAIDNHLTALIDGITPSQSTLWKGVVAGTVNLGIGMSLDPISGSLQVVIAALCIGALSYGLSIVLYIRSAQLIGAKRAQVVFSSAPAFGVVLAVLVLGEQLELTSVLAGALLVVAVALLFIDAHAHEHAHEPTDHKHSHRHDDDDHHDHLHPGLPAWTRHTHQHRHEPQIHSHPHWPDLHHRHRHGGNR